MTARQTDALQLRLITLLNRADSELERDSLRSAQLPEGTPSERYFYLLALGIAWGKLYVFGAIFLSGIAFLFHLVSGGHGTAIWVLLLVFISAFCITGMVDVAWRIQLVGSARRRWKRAGFVVDDRTLRLMRLSRINDGTLVLQITAGAVAAWHFS
jgi:hypothetical protein